MEAKIKAIPQPNRHTDEYQRLLERNRELDRNNVEFTLKILQTRQFEAVSVDDRKKKYAAIAVACDQQDQFNIRNRIHGLEKNFQILRKSIPDDDWNFLEPLCDTVLEDESFWDRCQTQGNTSETEIHRVFKEEFDIQPKYIVKMIELIKIRQEIKKMESLDSQRL